MNRQTLLRSALALAALGLAFGAAAQSFPSKPLRIVVAFSPGGSADLGARMLAVQLAEDFKQPVVVENRVGAGGTIGAAHVAASAPDGYTLYLAGVISHASAAALYKNLPYDGLKSFAPIGRLSTAPFVVVVHPDSKIKSMRDLIEQAKKEPGRLTYASSGNGAAPHLAAELISRSSGTRFTHVPFKGAAPALLSVLSGQVDFMVADVSAGAHIREGKLRALALTTAQASRLMPGVAPLPEHGVNGLDVRADLALLAPAGTPPEVINRINAAMNAALARPEMQDKLRAQGLEAAGGTPESLARSFAVDIQDYGRIVRDADIRID